MGTEVRGAFGVFVWEVVASYFTKVAKSCSGVRERLVGSGRRYQAWLLNFFSGVGNRIFFLRARRTLYAYAIAAI